MKNLKNAVMMKLARKDIDKKIIRSEKKDTGQVKH